MMRGDQLTLLVFFTILLIGLFVWSSANIANKIIKLPIQFDEFTGGAGILSASSSSGRQHHDETANKQKQATNINYNNQQQQEIYNPLLEKNYSSLLNLDTTILNATQQQQKKREPRILCWVMTIDGGLNLEKSKAVRETWGKRCDKLLIVRNGTKLDYSFIPPESAAVSENNNNNNKLVSVLTLPIMRESRAVLWRKVQQAFTFIYRVFLNDYDWFMKADDDTYVLVDNLREFLSQHSPKEPTHFGYRFKPYVKQGYMSGGAGYVLSREAVKLLVEKGLRKRLPACHLSSAVEDVDIGSCLEAVKVSAGDTRDEKGRPRFLPLSPDWMLTNKEKKSFWYYWYWFYGPPGTGKECCSDKPISFHYIPPQQMYMIDWLLYDVKRLPYNSRIIKLNESSFSSSTHLSATKNSTNMNMSGSDHQDAKVNQSRWMLPLITNLITYSSSNGSNDS